MSTYIWTFFFYINNGFYTSDSPLCPGYVKLSSGERKEHLLSFSFFLFISLSPFSLYICQAPGKDFSVIILMCVSVVTVKPSHTSLRAFLGPFDQISGA